MNGAFDHLRENFFATLTAVLGAGVLIGFGLGYFSTSLHYQRVFSTIGAIRSDNPEYQFTRPLLAYALPEATDVGQYVGLKSDIEENIAAAKSEGITKASVYFRDLDTSSWIGINENDTYFPASLLKVPVMIAYYKEAEVRPGTLSHQLTYDSAVLPKDPYQASSLLTAGDSYSVQDLIARMIRESDNGATFTLLAQLSPDFLHGVYQSLGVQDPGDNSANYQISTKTYALFFRILYNATYLSADSSERALKLLTQTTYDNGIVAGVPTGTLVAHKFGEHVLTDTKGGEAGVELHDCGIVYYPEHPYVLCVMTAAQNLPAAESFIGQISKTTYAAVNERYSGK